MIGAIFNTLFNLIISLVNILLTPLDMLIQAAFPSVADFLSSVNAMFSLVLSGLGWVIGLTCLPPLAFQLLLLYFTFVLTVPLAISSIKLVIRWYNALKP